MLVLATIVTRLTEHDDVMKSLLRGAPRPSLALGHAHRSYTGTRAQVLHWASHLLGPALLIAVRHVTLYRVKTSMSESVVILPKV